MLGAGGEKKSGCTMKVRPYPSPLFSPLVIVVMRKIGGKGKMQLATPYFWEAMRCEAGWNECFDGRGSTWRLAHCSPPSSFF